MPLPGSGVVRRQKGQRRLKRGAKPGKTPGKGTQAYLVVLACLDQLTGLEKRTLVKLLLRNLHLREKL